MTMTDKPEGKSQKAPTSAKLASKKFHYYYQFTDDLYTDEKDTYVKAGKLWKYKGYYYYYLGFHSQKPTALNFETEGRVEPFGEHPPYTDFVQEM